MGIRESLLNTITSVGDSDFVRLVTSAGTSSKATVKNLFKGFESNLGAKSSLTDSDYIRVVGSDNEAYKQSVSAVKTALGIDSLNSKMLASLGTVIPTNANLNDYLTPGRFYAGDISGIANLPTTTHITSIDMIVFPRASTVRVWQLCFVYYSTPQVYIRAQNSATGFTDWIQLA